MFTLEVLNLCKSFGKLKAVDDVSFGVTEGEVFGLIGRNGAGKTTTIRMMMDIIGPDRGQVLYRGKPTDENFRKIVTYLPEERGLYKTMKVIDVLNFFLEIRGIEPRSVRQLTHDYLDRFQLGDRHQTRIEELSKGNQQKIQFIAAVVSNPEVLVLDEPFSGLDPVNTGLLKDIILDLKKQGKVIIFSTHLMDLAERMCDHIALIHNGQLKLNGRLKEIKQKYSQRNVTLIHEGDLGFLKGHPIIESMHEYGNSTGIKVRQHDDIQTLLRLLVEGGIVIKKFDANDISLQEIFLEVAGDEVKPDPVSAAATA